MILVTGGTGLVGSHLLMELSRKQKLRALKRENSDLDRVLRVFEYHLDKAEAKKRFANIEWVVGDINNIPELKVAFQNISIVYHCAALISLDPKDEKDLRKINIEGTANIVNLCIANKVKKLCYVSSIASLGKSRKGEPISEESRWNPEINHSDYAISKYGAEIEVWRGTQEGLPAIIVNPGIIIGPGFWNSGSGQLFSRVANGLNYHFPKVTGFIGVCDVVESMITLMQTPIRNEQYILITENLSFKEVLSETAKALHKPIPKKQLKPWMIKTAWIFQKMGSFLGFKQQITRDSITGLYEETHYNNEKIKESIPITFTPVFEAIENTARIYLSEKN